MTGIREIMNDWPRLTGTIALVATLALAGYLAWWWEYERMPPPSTRAYYSTDDGASWFDDEGSRIPPFLTPDGKTAVRAYVVECPDGRQHVAFLERMTESAKAELEQAQRRKALLDTPTYNRLLESGTEYKLPGPDEQWMSRPEFRERGESLTCPDGGPPRMVLP